MTEKLDNIIDKIDDVSEKETFIDSVALSNSEGNKKKVSLPKKQPADKLDFLLDIPLEISVELGRTRMFIHDLLKLGHGSIIELSKLSGDTLDIFANQKLIAKGEVVSVEDKYGIRLTEIISPQERVEKLK